MFSCSVSSLSWIQSNLDFIKIFEVASKSGQRPWAIVQGILAKMAPRDFSIFIIFSDTYACPYAQYQVWADSDQIWI